MTLPRSAARLRRQRRSCIFGRRSARCIAFEMIDARFVYGTFNPVAAWRRCDRYIALVRRLTSNPTAYDKFEALVASYAPHSEKWLPTRTPSVRRALDLS